MADVRSLLRSELAARKGSSQSGNSTNRVTKKRKVDPTDGSARKKVRQASATPDQLLAHAQIQPPSAQVLTEEEEIEEPEQSSTTPTASSAALVKNETDITTEMAPPAPPIPSSESTTNPQTIDEDEWDAFEREVAAPTRVPYRPAAVAATATISAAPISTEELATLEAKDNDATRSNREAEVEGEREDAARFMEEEFDEMEQLEERVRRLKHKREQLRTKRTTEVMDESTKPQNEAKSKNTNDEDEHDEDDDADDDDDVDDDWDNWRFR